MRLIGIFLLLFSLSFHACKSKNTEQQKAPLNFILIYTDEMEFSDLGCYGGEFPTPNIDRLAERGIKFTSAYTVSSMCTPSRYTVLTGQFPGRCTAPSFLEENPVDEPYNIAWNSWITADKQTLPRVLSENGYITGMAGKWHIGEVPDTMKMPRFKSDDSLDDPEIESKLVRQQEIYRALVKQQAGFDEANSVLWGNFDGQKLKALIYHNFPWMTNGALSFLEHQQGKEEPFFLYFAPTAVHGPNHYADLEKDITYTPGGRDKSLSSLQLDVDALKKQLAEFPGNKRHRYAGMAQTDHAVGQIVKKLDEIGKADNTVLIFMCDHNIEPGKATSYEKGIHVPMIVVWPGIEGGTVREAMVQNADIYPTILASAGISMPEGYPLDGTSILPVLDDYEAKTRDFIFSENGYTRSVSDGTWKYIALRYPESRIEKMQSGELEHAPSYVDAWPQAHSAIAMHAFPAYFDQDQVYNIKEDPYELDNRYEDMAESETFHTLKKALEEHLSLFKHPFDLDRISFLETEDFRELTEQNMEWDLGNIPWLRTDHGTIHWPPEN